jgi:uncharacterized protein YaaR (DUF327 family)
MDRSTRESSELSRPQEGDIDAKRKAFIYVLTSSNNKDEYDTILKNCDDLCFKLKRLSKADFKAQVEKYYDAVNFLREKRFLKELHNYRSTLVILIFGDKHENTNEFNQHIRTMLEYLDHRERMFQIIYFHGELADTWSLSGAVPVLCESLPKQ